MGLWHERGFERGACDMKRDLREGQGHEKGFEF